MDYHLVGSLPFQNILHLTDFSACSDVAFMWATGLARANRAKLSLLHVVVPDTFTYMTPESLTTALELQEKWAREQMQRIEERLADLPHETIIERDGDVWSVVEPRLERLGSDLIVVGTQGRTGLRKMLMGSVAERVLRSSSIPVMTVGPDVLWSAGRPGKFRRVLLATDFTASSVEAASYAISIAQGDQAELVLVHACDQDKSRGANKGSELPVAEALHRLDQTIPSAEKLRSRPETLVEYGEPGARIVEVAKRKEADLIVMGIRNTTNLFAATRLSVGTAYTVVTRAPCPVLTVRPKVGKASKTPLLEKDDELVQESKTLPSQSPAQANERTADAGCWPPCKHLR